jgi:hypothetical protein
MLKYVLQVSWGGHGIQNPVPFKPAISWKYDVRPPWPLPMGVVILFTHLSKSGRIDSPRPVPGPIPAQIESPSPVPGIRPHRMDSPSPSAQIDSPIPPDRIYSPGPVPDPIPDPVSGTAVPISSSVAVTAPPVPAGLRYPPRIRADNEKDIVESRDNTLAQEEMIC